MRGPSLGIRSDSANLCLESRAPLKPTAVVDAESVCIAAGERAVVPVRWDRGVPSSDFWVEGCEENQLAVEPGPCSGASYEVMLCIANESGMDIVLERGDPIAEAHEWILPPVSNGSRREGRSPEVVAEFLAPLTGDTVTPISETQQNLLAAAGGRDQLALAVIPIPVPSMNGERAHISLGFSPPMGMGRCADLDAAINKGSGLEAERAVPMLLTMLSDAADVIIMADTEWIEKAIPEDVARAQLTKGSSLWGFPAFPTKLRPESRATQRGAQEGRGLQQNTASAAASGSP